MITTEFRKGQGLGNQLWCYVTARVLALDKGFKFGVRSPENFVGKELFDLDLGEQPVEGIRRHFDERPLIHPLSGADIRGGDERLHAVEDGTELVGLFQDEAFIRHRKEEIKEWLKLKPEADCRDYSSDDVCIINFRGGGYVFDVDFFLPWRYWRDAVAHMRKINPKFRFVVVTDDVKTAKKFFPDFEVNHWSPAKDFAVVKNARYLIASNSSFAFFPAFLSNDLRSVIGPKYWGRHNISDGYWSLGCNIFDGWRYLDRKGNLQDADSCRKELAGYMKAHPELYFGSVPFKPSLSQRMRNDGHIFMTLRKDIGAIPALAWLAHARGLRAAIWVKDRLANRTRRAKGLLKRAAKRAIARVKRFKSSLRERRVERRAKKSWLSPAGIAGYRKKIRVVDAVYFFNELDLLEMRLEILDPRVDLFVVVESTIGFTGGKKPLHFQENKARFKKWEGKILHHVVTNAPRDEDDLRQRLTIGKNPDGTPLSPLDREMIENALATDNFPHGGDTQWLREFFFKESMKAALVKAGLHDDDFVFVSDVDEVWNPELLIDYSQDSVFKPTQTEYVYFLNNRSDQHWRGWSGTIATKYKNVRDACLNHLRTHRKMMAKYVFLRGGGWHFTFQGGMEGFKKKILESDNPEYYGTDFAKAMDKVFQKGLDPRGRDIRFAVDERDLPRYLRENREKWKRFFK